MVYLVLALSVSRYEQLLPFQLGGRQCLFSLNGFGLWDLLDEYMKPPRLFMLLRVVIFL